MSNGCKLGTVPVEVDDPVDVMYTAKYPATEGG